MLKNMIFHEKTEIYIIFNKKQEFYKKTLIKAYIPFAAPFVVVT